MRDIGAAEIKAALHALARVSLDLLCEKFCQDHLLGEVLRSDDNSAVCRATCKQDHDDKQCSSNSLHEFARGTRTRRSMIPKAPSAASANSAAGTAAASIQR